MCQCFADSIDLRVASSLLDYWHIQLTGDITPETMFTTLSNRTVKPACTGPNSIEFRFVLLVVSSLP